MKAATLAKLANVDRPTMSLLLANYRERQGAVATRYVIACREYGRNARWFLLALPKTDPAGVPRARQTAAVWSLEDAVRRFAKDARHEIRPGLHATVDDQHLNQVVTFAESNIASVVQLVRGMLGQ